jgi:hypothetical protein
MKALTSQTADRSAAGVLLLALLGGGCATIANSKENLVFLSVPEGICEDPKAHFTVDGAEVPCSFREYSRSEVSRTNYGNYEKVTYNVVSLPSLLLSSTAQYHTVGVSHPALGDHKALIKRDLIDGYRFYLYLDTMLTLGIGTVADIYGDHLWGYSGVNFMPSSPPSTPVAGGLR